MAKRKSKLVPNESAVEFFFREINGLDTAVSLERFKEVYEQAKALEEIRKTEFGISTLNIFGKELSEPKAVVSICFNKMSSALISLREDQTETLTNLL